MAQAIAHLEQRAFEIGADVSAVNKLHMIGRLEDNYMLDKPENASQLSFFQSATGITDSKQLKEHIISIAKEAYDVFPYPCIWALYFCKTRVITHPAYAEVLELSKNEDCRPIFLDVGSFAGIDLRQVVHTGMKPENVMGTDLIDDWAKIGNKLFNGNGVIPFVKGDIFCNSFFDRSTPSPPAFMDSTSIQLNQLESLNPLKQKVRFITCNSVFHLFDEERQTELARRLASLLNNQKSGSTIFGTHVGSDDCYLLEGTGKRGMFMHSPETWKKMWEKIYQPGEARIQVELGPPEPITHLKDFRSMTMLIWSVTIL
ncbi:hypothetical protein MJO28_014656 [Puccinia striiformis f. sp. tritici]|uniref:Methyltransferase domain-containing protein n=5 Tax=Puccinia striiformis TaxID=27350 RepID=A0A0L0W2P6_9BASI|nr:hypothetical protein Pst134EA_027014 [Puccinia striiformis f. sp. tritici]KAI9629986.1 hypothetical protein KEM48_012396 [Puccinia striiformis f. sp. tritici PST-130]KNF05781.1 hypothetical protein PSTG_01178 [Puccinia striiformis f. sp. tritici PST-78]POV94824.1 hypothetical protein PSHT_16002 [Puccinia striiformis]KAH9443202.1 hypothetical protein Pst134EB_027554 [Puccinia striiformis f. sp. tritici]KAH9450307.1 hypothetical protein Pst134EA_027014 [Puccinia striiformis f. sp. tritici]